MYNRVGTSVRSRALKKTWSIISTQTNTNSNNILECVRMRSHVPSGCCGKYRKNEECQWTEGKKHRRRWLRTACGECAPQIFNEGQGNIHEVHSLQACCWKYTAYTKEASPEGWTLYDSITVILWKGKLMETPPRLAVAKDWEVGEKNNWSTGDF